MGGYTLSVYILNYLSILLYAKIFNRRSFCIVASTQLFIILALRADTLGADLQVYASAFEYISRMDVLDMLSRIRLVKNAVLPYPYSLESGWMLLNWFISYIGFNFRTLLVVCAAINMYAYGKLVYRYSNIPWMSYCIFLALNTYTYMFGILRQSLAMSIVILAVMAFDSNKNKALILSLLAFAIHRTAIIVLIFFYIMKKKPKKKQLFMTFVLGWPLFLIISPFIYRNIIIYMMRFFQKGYQGTGLQWNYLMGLLILIGIMIIFLYSFNNIKNPVECLSIWSIIAAMYWETFGMMNATLARGVQYFIVFITLAVPYVLGNYFDYKIVRLGKIAVSIMLFVYMIVSLQGTAIVPYYTLFK